MTGICEMTEEQKLEYGFVKLTEFDLSRIGYKRRAPQKVLIAKRCEACGERHTSVKLQTLSQKNRTVGRTMALLCYECGENNLIGRSIIKGWLE
ncbi:hypothetical protein NYE70_25905 [Paenibacillus sp. FSL R5-0407]|uniref:hypothetical protein n=1 Tax=Paenibacillus sp. FSL R5-0407 TaxID=2975320 RepID=UPI0030FBF489